VGLSGDVAQLSWTNLAYQPYFSATAANVAHGFWSHDIEGPANNMEMYTRWIQVRLICLYMELPPGELTALLPFSSSSFSRSALSPE
jgi:alpha-glucosidase (family GH31 glycosyl hydrolase)